MTCLRGILCLGSVEGSNMHIGQEIVIEYQNQKMIIPGSYYEVDENNVIRKVIVPNQEIWDFRMHAVRDLLRQLDKKVGDQL